jgi:plasmid segregation protein ParM
MTAKNTPKIVRAIDVGHGNTKFVAYHKHGADIQCSMFPSIAPHSSGGNDLNGGVFQSLNTVRVEVQGVMYEVGKDARLAQDASYGRGFSDEYSLQDDYMALVRGCIFFMNAPHIDLLVVGLPVNTFDKYEKELKNRLIATHRVPAMVDGRPDPVKTVEVEIRDVRVLPQPIGAFFDYSITHQVYGRMKTQMNLLVDPGYYTLDWVVAQGVKIIKARSGAHAGGMSAVLSAMAEAIGRDIGVQLTDVSPIDEALRTGTNPYFFNKELDLSKYIGIGKEKARQFVSVMATNVGNKGVDIKNIILAGGGAQFFKEAIQNAFPQHELVVTKDPVFANVRGFQLAGEQFANQESFIKNREAATS